MKVTSSLAPAKDARQHREEMIESHIVDYEEAILILKIKKTPKYSQDYGGKGKTVQMSILLSAMSLSCTFWLLWMQLRIFFGDCLDVLE